MNSRFLYSAGILLAIGSITLVLVFLYYRSMLLTESVDSRLSVFQQWMQDKLTSQMDLLHSEVAPLASLPEVVDAMRDRDRERLKSFILPYMERFRPASGIDTFYYHFHLPPAISFLRTWDLDKTGEDLSLIRPMVVRANKYKVAYQGVEVGPGGAVLRSIVPVSDKGGHLGTVEVASTIDGILELTHIPSNFGALLLLDKRFSSVIQPSQNMRLHGKWIVFRGMHTGDEKALLAALDAGTIPQRTGNTFYRFMSLDDFQGQTIGGLLLAYDSNTLVGSTRYEAVIFGLAFACGAMTLMFLLYMNVRRVKLFLSRFKRIIIATNIGDFSERFETEPIHCLEVMHCDKRECPVYENPSLICYMETGSEAIAQEHRNSCLFIKKYRKCQFCPVYALRHGDELVEMRNAVNTMLRIWGTFTSRVHKVVSEVLHTNEQADRQASLAHISANLEHMAGLTAFTHDLQGVIRKEEVYGMLHNLFSRNFRLGSYAIFEVNPSDNRMEVAADALKDKSCLCSETFHDPSLCRAKRVVDMVSSHDNTALCPYFHINHESHVRSCLPLVMGGRVGGIITFVFERSLWHEKRLSLSIIQKYLSECAPVLSTLQLVQITKESSLRDALTGLHNRRFLDEYIRKYEAIAARDGKTVGFIMADMDHFKQLNDQYGHLAGDSVLKDLSEIITAVVRQADLVVRFGGEEFLILLHEVRPGFTKEVAEKIRYAVEKHSFALPNGSRVRKTISLGTAEYPADADTFYKAIKHADLALYSAKEAGRNRAVVYESGMSKDTSD